MRPLIAVLVLLLTVPGVWAADQPSGAATAHVRKATAAYNLGKYTEAAAEYEAAYEQTLDPNLLFNIGQACRLAGDPEKALTAYRSFLRSAPQSEQRRLAESKIRELERQRSVPPLATRPVPATAPSPAVPAPAPAAAPSAPAIPPPAAAPGLASAPVVISSNTETAGGLVATPAVPEPPPPPPFYARWPFWTGVGAVVVGAVVLGVVLSHHSNDVTMNTKFGTQEF